MRSKSVWILVIGVCVGCQTPPTSPTPSLSQSSPQAEEPQGFSIGRMLQFAGFSRTSEAPPTLVPQEVLQLGQVANNVVAQASELNVNDPPELTKQKAQGILDSLRPWDSLLAAGRSVGLLNDDTVTMLNSYVVPLKSEAQKLVEFLPNPETIAAIQQLAGGLQATMGPLSAMFTAAPQVASG